RRVLRMARAAQTYDPLVTSGTSPNDVPRVQRSIHTRAETPAQARLVTRGVTSPNDVPRLQRSTHSCPRGSAAHHLGQAKREVERLAGIQARVEERLVAGRELLLEHVVCSAEAFRDVLARELEMDAAGPHV